MCTAGLALYHNVLDSQRSRLSAGLHFICISSNTTRHLLSNQQATQKTQFENTHLGTQTQITHPFTKSFLQLYSHSTSTPPFNSNPNCHLPTKHTSISIYLTSLLHPIAFLETNELSKKEEKKRYIVNY